MEALEYFATRQWSWDTQNVQALYNELSLDDQSLYNFSLKTFDSWNSYFEAYGLGAREFVMKSDPNTLDRCRKNIWKFYLVHQIVKYLPCIFLVLVSSWL